MNRLIVFIVLAFCSVHVIADNSKKPRPKKMAVDSSRALEIRYYNSSWNADSTKIDTGNIILKDKNSSAVVSVTLQETEPDSSEFTGLFVLSGQSISKMEPEVYFVGNEYVSDKGYKKPITTLIESGAAIRKPFLMTVNEKGLQEMDVFNSRSEAESALKSLKNKKESEYKEQPVKVAAAAVLEAQKLAEIEREKKRLEAESRARESERVRIEREEKRRIEEQLKQQAALSAEEKRKRQREAAAYAEAALDFFRVNNFKDAVANFDKAVGLDPENKTYYYRYGVALYKNENFNKSLVILRIADSKDFDPVERDFYIALNHYRLKEYSSSRREFKEIEAKNHDPLSPSSSFYVGMIDFNEARYEEAKPSFQLVLDTSKDPKLDERAEEMMEKIDRIMFFAKNKAKMFLLNASYSPVYDSNVLIVADSAADKSSPSDLAAYRSLFAGFLHFRPVYEKEYEAGIKFKGNYDFTHATTSAQDDYDTFIYSYSVPLVYKSTLFGKGYKLDINPGYETLHVGQEVNTTQPKLISNGTFADMGNTFVMSDDWFSTLNLKYKQDKYKDTPAQDSTKLTFGLNNALFFNKAKTLALIIDANYSNNDAQADASDYTRTDLSALFTAPWEWDIQAVLGLNTYMLDYAKALPVRKDTNLTGSFTLAKPITEWLKSSFNFAYISNQSTITTNTYRKFNVGFNFTMDVQF